MTTIPNYVPGAVLLPDVGSGDIKIEWNKYETVCQKEKEFGTYGGISLGKELLSFGRYPIRRIWIIWF